jgi:hypothetical protein
MSAIVICQRGAVWQLFPCKVWDRKPNSSGYAFVYIKGSGAANPKFIGVHRKALAEKLGRPVRQDYDACHHCDVKLCYEPAHLYEGTRSDNMRDVIAHGGRLGRPSKLTPEQRAEILRRVSPYGGETQAALAKDFGVTVMVVNRIARGVKP